MSIFNWYSYMVAEKYIEKHKKQYEAHKSAGRRRSKKRSIYRRRRSSKARKSRKSRNTRRK
jgi:hypothetical protein